MTKDNPFEKSVSYYPYERKIPVKQKTIEEPVDESAKAKDVEKWKEEANAYLRHYGIPKRVVDIDRYEEIYDSRWHNFLIVFFLIAVVAFMAFAGWGIYNDKFKTDVTCEASIIPECPAVPQCPTAPACPACPGLSCGNVTVQIPKNLKITIENNLTGGNESD